MYHYHMPIKIITNWEFAPTEAFFQIILYLKTMSEKILPEQELRYTLDTGHQVLLGSSDLVETAANLERNIETLQY